MRTSMKDNGETHRNMATALRNIPTEITMSATSEKESFQALEPMSGRMARHTKELTKMVKRMAKEDGW